MPAAPQAAVPTGGGTRTAAPGIVTVDAGSTFGGTDGGAGGRTRASPTTAGLLRNSRTVAASPAASSRRAIATIALRPIQGLPPPVVATGADAPAPGRVVVGFVVCFGGVPTGRRCTGTALCLRLCTAACDFRTRRRLLATAARVDVRPRTGAEAGSDECAATAVWGGGVLGNWASGLGTTALAGEGSGLGTGAGAGDGRTVTVDTGGFDVDVSVGVVVAVGVGGESATPASATPDTASVAPTTRPARTGIRGRVLWLTGRTIIRLSRSCLSQEGLRICARSGSRSRARRTSGRCRVRASSGVRGMSTWTEVGSGSSSARC